MTQKNINIYIMHLMTQIFKHFRFICYTCTYNAVIFKSFQNNFTNSPLKRG